MVEVIHPGFYTSIQDFGRRGYQEYGVPYSGVMDRYAASMANVLLGNPEYSAVMEMTMTGPVLQFKCSSLICISGANMSPNINGNNIRLNKVVPVKEGDRLSFGRLKDGFRSYLAVSGGFKTERVMNSYSMFKGITQANRVRKKDSFFILEHTNAHHAKYASIKTDRKYIQTEEISVFKGPEFDKLTRGQQHILVTKVFAISKHNNRMAYQLEEILENDLDPIITSSVLPGTVQLTPSGKMIVLMRDCQTTGGYPRVLQLKEMAINMMAQKFMGQSIRFKLLD